MWIPLGTTPPETERYAFQFAIISGQGLVERSPVHAEAAPIIGKHERIARASLEATSLQILSTKRAHFDKYRLCYRN